MSLVAEAVPKTVAEALSLTVRCLSEAGFSNGEAEAKEMVARALGIDRKTLDHRGEDRWSGPPPQILNSLLSRRLSHVPLAYLLGEWDFLNMTLTVTPDVLIPRPETEELFEWVVRDATASGGAPSTVADVGTGAGGLALAAARQWPRARVTAIDLSKGALAVARWNARRHGLEKNINFLGGDLLNGIADQSMDIVVANLPYVETADWAGLSPEVRREPPGALDGGPDGLTLIRRLIPQAVRALRPGGRLFLEVGQGQADDVAREMTTAGFSDVSTARDFAGIHRFLRGCR